jgi:hypothetical protein
MGFPRLLLTFQEEELKKRKIFQRITVTDTLAHTGKEEEEDKHLNTTGIWLDHHR